MTTIRVWHAPEPARAPVIWRAPEPDTSVRDRVWEHSHNSALRAAERKVLDLRRNPAVNVPLPVGKEAEPDLLLNAYTKPRSVRKVPNGGRLKLTGKHTGAYRVSMSALGEL